MTGRTGSAEVVELGSVPGFVVFDLPGAPLSAGGTRLAPDVSVAEVAVLARSMTYKFAALGERVGGAKAGVRGDPADRAGKAALMARFCAAVRPLTDAGRFLTGPDMGTAEEDFAPLRERRAAPAAISAVVAGVPFEDLLTGYGVAVAAETALGGGSKGRGPGRPFGGHRGFRQGRRRGGTRDRPARRPGGRGVDRGRVRRGPVRVLTSTGCSRCARRTATGASCTTAGRSCHRTSSSPR